MNIKSFLSEKMGIMELEESDKDFIILCPFHGEKTPSLHIDKKKQVWHCFGCHEKGKDLIDLYAKWKGIPRSLLVGEAKNLVTNTNLELAIHSKFYGQTVVFQAMITQISEVPKLVAKTIEYKCGNHEENGDELREVLDQIRENIPVGKVKDAVKNIDNKIVIEQKRKLSAKCARCPLMREGGWEPLSVVPLERTEIFLTLYHSSLSEERAILAKYFGISCGHFRYKVTETQNLTRMILQPDLLYTEITANSSRIQVEAFTQDFNIDPAKPHRFTAKVYRNPENQNVIFFILDSEQINKEKDRQITDVDKEALAIFLVGKEGAEDVEPQAAIS